MATGNDSGDWRSKCGSVLERWVTAREIGFHTDVDFLVGEKGSDAESFSAHKIVLAFSSPVFEAMFYGSLTEKTNPINITDMEPDAFFTLIRFMYGEVTSFSTVLQAARLYIAANKYLVSDLQAAAEDYVLKSNLDETTFWELVNDKMLIQVPMLKKKCLEFISSNTANLFKSYLFINILPEIVEEIVQLDKMNVSEFDLLSAMVRWSTANIQSDMTLKNRFQPLLKSIRFSNLTVDEYCSFLDCHPGLIDNDDSLSIMKHLTKPTIYKLPQWYSTDEKRRNV